MGNTHPEERIRRMIIIMFYVNLMSSNYLEGEGDLRTEIIIKHFNILIQIKVILDKTGFSNKISITYSLICGR